MADGSLEQFVSRVAESGYTIEQLAGAIKGNVNTIRDYANRHGIIFSALPVFDDVEDFVENYRIENDIAKAGFTGLVAYLTRKEVKYKKKEDPDKPNKQVVDCPDGSTRTVNTVAERDFYNEQVKSYLEMEVEYEHSDLSLLAQLVNAELETRRIMNEISDIDMKQAAGGYAPAPDCIEAKCPYIKLHAAKIKDDLRKQLKVYADSCQKLQGELSISRKSRNVNVEDPLKIFERTAEELFEHRMNADWQYNALVICPDCNQRLIARTTVQSFRAYEAELLPLYLQNFIKKKKVTDEEKDLLEKFLSFQLKNLQSEEYYAELLQVVHKRDNDKDFTGAKEGIKEEDDSAGEEEE